MNAEGLARNVSPEWVQATATGLISLLAAFWLVAALGWLWRRTIWQRAGVAITAVATAHRTAPIGQWWGYSVTRSDGWRVEWVMTVDGPVTRAVKGKERRVREGWDVDLDALIAA